ncbi:MAG: Calx-beta domain-containing protein [Pirellulaceae bacterium]
MKVHIDSDDAKQAGEFGFSAASLCRYRRHAVGQRHNRAAGRRQCRSAPRLYDTGLATAGRPRPLGPVPTTRICREVVFAAGEMSKTISIPIVDDGSTERDGSSIQLYSPSNDATIGALATTQVTIQDNDSAIEFAQSNYVVNESTGVMQIKIRRIGSTAGTATVDLNINSGGATAGQDFIKPPSPTVTFADGEFEKLVDIAIVDDVFAEGDESFYLSLSNATGAKLGTYLWGGGKILASD